MITSLRLVNFKNFADETLHLGPFTLIVGANASGKSNIRDAFRFLHRNWPWLHFSGESSAGSTAQVAKSSGSQFAVRPTK